MNEEKPPKCSQCDNQAYAIGSGPPLCVECLSKLPVAVPNPPRVAIIALNFSIVEHLDASITSIRARGGEDVGAALAKLMHAVLDSRDLTREAKSAVLGQVGYLGTQAAEPAPKRQTVIVKLVIDGLRTTLVVAKDLAELWQAVEPILRGIATVDREQLHRDLSDASVRVQRDQDVTDLDVLAASLIALGGQYAFHGEQLLKALERVPRDYNAVIWNVGRSLEILETAT